MVNKTLRAAVNRAIENGSPAFVEVPSTFRFHTDPAHGWLEIPPGVLSQLGLKISDFSGYSYIARDGVTFYLEEDCDASKFAALYLAKYGVELKTISTHVNGSHPIRSMRSNR